MPRKSTNYGQRFIGAEAHEDACLKMAKKGPSTRGPKEMPMTFGEFSQANRERCESPQGFNHPLAGW